VIAENQSTLFAYNQNAPFDLQVLSSEDRDGVTIQDITFVGVAGSAPVSAYLVTPAGAGSFAGILWGHWLGEENSNRIQYLEEAVELAKSGVISLLPNAMWSQPGWYSSRVLDQDYANGVRQVIEFCRAMDLLLAQPQVDAARIAFVGHDYSGMYGTLAAVKSNKAKAYVFVAVTPSFYDWAFYSTQPADKEAYLRQNDPLEILRHLPQIKNGSFLFQFAATDEYVPEEKRSEFYATAPEPKTLKVYDDATHQMHTALIAADRDAWLKAQLGL
jgi:dienelactone hydrolase